MVLADIIPGEHRILVFMSIKLLPQDVSRNRSILIKVYFSFLSPFLLFIEFEFYYIDLAVIKNVVL